MTAAIPTRLVARWSMSGRTLICDAATGRQVLSPTFDIGSSDWPYFKDQWEAMVPVLVETYNARMEATEGDAA